MKKLLGIMAVVTIMATSVSAGPIEEAFKTQNKLILEIARSHTNAIVEVKALQEQVRNLTATVAALESRLAANEQRTRVTEEIAVSLRSDTFDLKANITQLEGAIRDLQKENKKGWF